MEFEWDEDKRSTNLTKHGIDLLDAVFIFEGVVLTEVDHRHDYGETRYVSTGYANGNCYVVIHTKRGNLMRLISARKGGRRDRRRYQESIARGNPGDEGAG